ncbi:MAG: hypothetical protein RLZZ210_1469 [Pseudomonadota bacterium]|jgi:hypothetical protein
MLDVRNKSNSVFTYSVLNPNRVSPFLVTKLEHNRVVHFDRAAASPESIAKSFGHLRSQIDTTHLEKFMQELSNVDETHYHEAQMMFFALNKLLTNLSKKKLNRLTKSNIVNKLINLPNDLTENRSLEIQDAISRLEYLNSVFEQDSIVLDVILYVTKQAGVDLLKEQSFSSFGNRDSDLIAIQAQLEDRNSTKQYDSLKFEPNVKKVNNWASHSSQILAPLYIEWKVDDNTLRMQDYKFHIHPNGIKVIKKQVKELSIKEKVIYELSFKINGFINLIYDAWKQSKLPANQFNQFLSKFQKENDDFVFKYIKYNKLHDFFVLNRDGSLNMDKLDNLLTHILKINYLFFDDVLQSYNLFANIATHKNIDNFVFSKIYANQDIQGVVKQFIRDGIESNNLKINFEDVKNFLLLPASYLFIDEKEYATKTKDLKKQVIDILNVARNSKNIKDKAQKLKNHNTPLNRLFDIFNLVAEINSQNQINQEIVVKKWVVNSKISGLILPIHQMLEKGDSKKQVIDLIKSKYPTHDENAIFDILNFLRQDILKKVDSQLDGVARDKLLEEMRKISPVFSSFIKKYESEISQYNYVQLSFMLNVFNCLGEKHLANYINSFINDFEGMYAFNLALRNDAGIAYVKEKVNSGHSRFLQLSGSGAKQTVLMLQNPMAIKYFTDNPQLFDAWHSCSHHRMVAIRELLETEDGFDLLKTYPRLFHKDDVENLYETINLFKRKSFKQLKDSGSSSYGKYLEYWCNGTNAGEKNALNSALFHSSPENQQFLLEQAVNGNLNGKNHLQIKNTAEAINDESVSALVKSNFITWIELPYDKMDSFLNGSSQQRKLIGGQVFKAIKQ